MRGGTRGPRRRARSSHPNWKEPVLPGAGAEPPQPGAQALRARAGPAGREAARGPRTSGRTCPQSGCRRAPLTVRPSAGVRSGQARQDARGRGGWGAVPRDPTAGLGSGTARPLPSVTHGPGPGRARARHGLVHVGRRAHAGPAPSLAALRARSTWSAARPRGRRRPAAAGIG